MTLYHNVFILGLLDGWLQIECLQHVFRNLCHHECLNCLFKLLFTEQTNYLNSNQAHLSFSFCVTKATKASVIWWQRFFRNVYNLRTKDGAIQNEIKMRHTTCQSLAPTHSSQSPVPSVCLTLMQVKLINVIPYCTMTMTNQKHPPLNATVKNDKRLSNNEEEEQRRKLLITLEEGVWSWHRPCPQSTTHPIKFDSPNHGRLCLSPA